MSLAADSPLYKELDDITCLLTFFLICREHLDSSDVQKVLEELERSDRFEGRPIAIGLGKFPFSTIVP